MEPDPDLTFCGLSLWVHQRQFPNATDYWDGNWLKISATMEASGAFVRCGGPILMTADIERFRNGVAAMAAILSGEAELIGLEPGLNVKLTMRDGKGHLDGVIEITPDHINQQHRFKVEMDQSYLPALVLSCDVVLANFPVTNVSGQ